MGAKPRFPRSGEYIDLSFMEIVAHFASYDQKYDAAPACWARYTMNMLLHQYVELLAEVEIIRFKNQSNIILDVENVLRCEYLHEQMNEVYENMLYVGMQAPQWKVDELLLTHVVYGKGKHKLAL